MREMEASWDSNTDILVGTGASGPKRKSPGLVSRHTEDKGGQASADGRMGGSGRGRRCSRRTLSTADGGKAAPLARREGQADGEHGGRRP